MDDNLKEEIETLKAVYNDDEISIVDAEGAINISYSTELDRHFVIKVLFSITKDASTHISVSNADKAKKHIPTEILIQIEQILKDKYDSEGEYMPIFQCISFCNDELFEDESLNLSNQLRNIPFYHQTKGNGNTASIAREYEEQEMMTYAHQRNINRKDYYNMNKHEYKQNKQNDFESYWRDMNKFNKECLSATIRNVGNDNYHKSKSVKDDEKKENDKDDVLMGSWARYSLKQIDINLWNAVPTISQIRALLKKRNKKITPENYSIHFCAKYPVIMKFLENVEYGAFSNYDVVYNTVHDSNTQKVIENGWDFKPDNYYQFMPYWNGEFSKFKEINPCCADSNVFLSIIRIKNEYKNRNESGSDYLIKNELDICPIYLLKFYNEKNKNANSV